MTLLNHAANFGPRCSQLLQDFFGTFDRPKFSLPLQLLCESRHLIRADIRRATLQSMSCFLKHSEVFLLNSAVNSFYPPCSVRNEQLNYLPHHFLTVIFFMLSKTLPHVIHSLRRRFTRRTVPGSRDGGLVR